MERKTLAILRLANISEQELKEILENAVAWVDNESPSSDNNTMDKARLILELLSE